MTFASVCVCVCSISILCSTTETEFIFRWLCVCVCVCLTFFAGLFRGRGRHLTHFARRKQAVNAVHWTEKERGVLVRREEGGGKQSVLLTYFSYGLRHFNCISPTFLGLSGEQARQVTRQAACGRWQCSQK